MDTNFSTDSDSRLDLFFRPKQTATPVVRHISFTVRIRLLHNDPESSLQNTPKSVATVLHTQHHKPRRNPLTAIVHRVWQAMGGKWQTVIQRLRIRLPGLLRTAVLAKTGKSLLQRIQTTGLVAAYQTSVIANASGVKQSRTLLVETLDYCVGSQSTHSDSGGQMNRLDNLLPFVITNCATVRPSSIAAESTTGLLDTTDARDSGMYVAPAQRGAVLITGLIFLVVLTLLGTTALQGTVLEEKMAGNLRDETLAFQAAEAALRSGEQFLEQVTLPEFNGENGLYHYACSSVSDAEDEDADEPLVCPPTPDPVTGMNWNADDSIEADVAMEGVASQPRYFIEQLPSVPLMGDGGSAQQSGASLNASMFRIVAQGTGGTEAATVLLQSTYRR